jgi:nitroreductase
MDFFRLIQLRESTRKYSNTPVEREKIIKILQACRLAPSACNSQPWSFVVADDPKLKDELAAACRGPLMSFNKFVQQAPVIVAIVGEKPSWLSRIGGNVKQKDFYLMDIGITANHFCLQATELGLGSCMLGWFDEQKAKEILNIPSDKRLLLMITLGYPAKNTLRKKIRKPLENILKWNSY